MTSKENEAGRLNRDPAEGGKVTIEEAIAIQSRDLPAGGGGMADSKPESRQPPVEKEEGNGEEDQAA